GFVVNVSQHKKSLGNTPKLGDGADEGGGPTAALNGAHEFGSAEGAQLQRAGDAQHVIPVVGDQFRVQPVASESVEKAVVGRSVDAPEPSLADILSRDSRDGWLSLSALLFSRRLRWRLPRPRSALP